MNCGVVRGCFLGHSLACDVLVSIMGRCIAFICVNLRLSAANVSGFVASERSTKQQLAADKRRLTQISKNHSYFGLILILLSSFRDLNPPQRLSKGRSGSRSR